jgi:glycosyltransferase involved in cell wall biosynthesis
MMAKLSILIPVFNEARTVDALGRGLADLPAGFIHEVIIVDDGSTDGSASRLSEILTSEHISNKLVTKANGGKGTAIISGIPECTGTHMVIFDADLELAVSDLVALFQPVLDGKAEVVFGIRKFSSQSSFTYRYVLGNHFLSHYYGVLFNRFLSDIMCGGKLLPVALWKELDLKLHGFTTEAEIAAKVWSAGYTPWEVPIKYSPRTREEGKGITVLDAVKIILLLTTLRLRLRRRK